jgi:hypothetical protein
VDDRNLSGYAQVLEEISGGAVQRIYTYGLNRISQSQASGTSFYEYDGHGKVLILTDATGTVTDRYDMAPGSRKCHTTSCESALSAKCFWGSGAMPQTLIRGLSLNSLTPLVIGIDYRIRPTTQSKPFSAHKRYTALTAKNIACAPGVD